MKPCPLCNYFMDPFDTECRRCHGKGLAPPPPVVTTAPPSPTQVTDPPVPVPVSGNETDPGPSQPSPDYALIAREQGLSERLLYRLYDAGESLLMIQAGPYDMFLREELEAQRQGSGKGVNKAEIAGRAIVTGARAGGVGGAGVGALGAGIVVGLGMLTSSIAGGEVKKRAEVLDLMTLDELREEAGYDKKSFVIQRDNVEQVKIRSRNDGFFAPDEPHFAGFLNFKHRVSGKWSLKVFSRRDLRMAADLLVRVLGEDRVERKLR